MKLNRRHIGLVGRWLALFLLVAQFGAEIHLYSHPLADPADRIGAARSCGACLASSQLQNAVASPPLAVPVRAMAWATIDPVASACPARIAPIRAFRSRAPPALA